MDPLLQGLRAALIEALREFEGRSVDEVRDLIKDRAVSTILVERPEAAQYRKDLELLVEFSLNQVWGPPKPLN